MADPEKRQNAYFLQDYEVKSDQTKVLLFFLLLEPNYIDADDKIEIDRETENETNDFGIRYTKQYAFTNDNIDIERILREIAAFPIPVICSRDSFAHYAESQTLYLYHKYRKDQPLIVNDLSIVSNVMLLEEDMIISSRNARPLGDLTTRELGFPYFQQYAMTGDLRIGKWHVTYDADKLIFCIHHDTYGVVYQSVELDKTATHRMVLYLIKKLSHTLPVLEDNYRVTTMIRKSPERSWHE